MQTENQENPLESQRIQLIKKAPQGIFDSLNPPENRRVFSVDKSLFWLYNMYNILHD